MSVPRSLPLSENVLRTALTLLVLMTMRAERRNSAQLAKRKIYRMCPRIRYKLLLKHWHPKLSRDSLRSEAYGQNHTTRGLCLTAYSANLCSFESESVLNRDRLRALNDYPNRDIPQSAARTTTDAEDVERLPRGQ